MSRVRVLVVVGNGEGGGTQVALAALRALDPARYQGTLVAPETAALARFCQDMGVTYAPLPLLESRVGRDVIARLDRLIAQEQFDVIHAHGTRAAWFISRCPAAHGAAPLIYSEHLLSFEARRGPAQLPWRALEIYLCRRAERVTTSCERNARFAERVGGKPVVIRRYGVDVAEIQRQAAQAHEGVMPSLALPPNATLIGSVGRLIPQKGLRYLIAAAPEIIQAEPSARFIIVGEGPERAALEAQAKAANVSERFHFVGALTQPWSLLARCSVIALPSLWEGLPLTLLEALAAGLPVVASDVGGAGEALRPHLQAGLTPPRDTRALARAVSRLLSDAALREQFQHEGRRIAAGYDIRDTQRAFATLYDDIRGAGATHGQRSRQEMRYGR